MDQNSPVVFNGSRAYVGDRQRDNAQLRYSDFIDVAFYGVATGAQVNGDVGLELAGVGHKVIVAAKSHYLKEIVVEQAEGLTLRYYLDGSVAVLCDFKAARVDIRTVKANVQTKLIDYIYTQTFKVDVRIEDVAELRAGALYLGLRNLADALQQVAAHYSARG